jgi:hypothetical protein
VISIKVNPYHTITPEKDEPGHRDVYHDLNNCPDGQRIKADAGTTDTWNVVPCL